MKSAAAELKRAQAEKAKIELEKMQGSLISAAEWERDIQHYAGEIRGAIESLGTISPEGEQLMLDTLNRLGGDFGVSTDDSSSVT